MKRLYTTACLAALVGGLSAQQVGRHIAKTSFDRLRTQTTVTAPAGMAKGACIFSEDFEGGIIPAGWVVGPQVEQYEDAPNGAPLGTFVDPWYVGTLADIDALPGTNYFLVPDIPAGNQFAYANDDGDPCNCGLSNVGLVTPAINLSGQTGAGLTVRLWHDGQYANSTGAIEVSTDGGLSFSNIYTIPEATGWQNVAVSLGAYDGLADVRLRFQWDDGGGWGTGIAVDDVCIAQLPPDDVALARVFLVEQPESYDGIARNLEYTKLPLEQCAPLTVGADVVNNGSADQTNLVLSAEIFVDGVSQGTFTSAAYPVLSIGTRDTITVATNWTPTAVGDVNVVLTVAGDQTDIDPADNTANKGFTVTNSPEADGYAEWSGDGNSLDAGLNLSQDNQLANYSAFGTDFQVANAGSMAYGLGVVFNSTTAPSAVISGFLSDGSADVASFDIFEIMPWHLSGTGENITVFIPFIDGGVELDPTLEYNVRVENPGNELVSLGGSGEANPGGLYGLDLSDGTYYQYIGWGNPAPMIRLFLAEAPSAVTEISSAGITLGANTPNPFSANTSISYELDAVHAVSMRVLDVTGKLVFEEFLGKQPAGKHMFTFDAASLAGGVYTYTLAADDVRLSRRMVVTR